MRDENEMNAGASDASEAEEADQEPATSIRFKLHAGTARMDGTQQRITLSAVAEPAGSESDPNQDWQSATPYAFLDAIIGNKAAQGVVKENRTYFLTLEEAPEDEQIVKDQPSV